MTLGEKQEKFSRMVMLLLIHLHALGYTCRGGHWLRCRDCNIGKKNSVHKDKLAFDINLCRPGRYLQGEESREGHTLLHDYWDSIGGAPRIDKDLNHYSLEHNGRW